MPLGLFDGIPYDEYSRKLGKGDMLYLYTDGVTEAMDVDGNLFEEARLEETLRDCSVMNARSVCLSVSCALTDYTLDAEQSDDITMLCLKYGVPPEKKAIMALKALDTQLVHARNFLHEELRRRGAPKVAYGQLDIAITELFSRVCEHAHPDSTPESAGEVRIGFEYDAASSALCVTMFDDGLPYNPLVDLDAVSDSPGDGSEVIGARQSVDDLRYERSDGNNVVTFVKKW